VQTVPAELSSPVAFRDWTISIDCIVSLAYPMARFSVSGENFITWSSDVLGIVAKFRMS
jgi:hypothetical protein